MGTADKSRNELLVTYQFFPIDAKPADNTSTIGSNWQRMTSLLRLKLADGKITAEQDDSCLPNPNTIETIPDARTALKKCAADSTAAVSR